MLPDAKVSGLIEEINDVFSEEITKGFRSLDQKGNITAAEFTTAGGKKIKFSTRRNPFAPTTLMVFDGNPGHEELAIMAERRIIGGGYMIDGQATMTSVPLTIPDPVSTAESMIRREIGLQRKRLRSRR